MIALLVLCLAQVGLYPIGSNEPIAVEPFLFGYSFPVDTGEILLIAAQEDCAFDPNEARRRPEAQIAITITGERGIRDVLSGNTFRLREFIEAGGILRFEVPIPGTVAIRSTEPLLIRIKGSEFNCF